MKTYRLEIISLLFLVTVVFTSSCTKYENPKNIFEDYTLAVDTTIQKKVLLITIEGAVGQDVKTIMPSTIASLLPNSKYTFDGLSETNTSDASTWASLMTGVFTSKHNIKDESFIGSASLDDIDAKLPFYPTVFYNLQKARPLAETLSITQWNPLSLTLLEHSDQRIDVETDIEARDQAIEKLTKENPIFTLVSFRSVLEAGIANGFSTNNTQYVDAINNVDGYVGEVIASLKERENYDKEDWLVIITSTHGGTGSDYGGSSEIERNIFGVFYYPKYKPLELKSQKLLTTKFNRYLKASFPDPNGVFDMNNTDLTFEAKIRVNPRPDGTYDYGNWSPMLGKSNWYIAKKGDNMRTYISSGTSLEPSAISFNDGLWHTYTTSIANKGDGNRTVKIYVDGALVTTESKSGFSDNQDNSNFEIGGKSGIDFNITEIRIWNKSLNDYEISETSCITNILPESDFYDGLISYWPGHEQGLVMYNQIDGMPDLETTLTANNEGVSIEDAAYTLSANSIPCSAFSENVTIENVSIAPQIYYWLGVPIEDNWKLDSKVFLSSFDIETVE